MSVLIICNSKTGFTKKYADDIVIFGSRVHAGKIEHLEKIKSRFGNRQSLIIFATGATPASETKAIDKVWADNFTETEMGLIPHFYMQSGLNYENMGFADRTIMKTVAKLLSGKKDKDETEAGFEKAIKSSHDISSREYIMPLVNYVTSRKTI